MLLYYKWAPMLVPVLIFILWILYQMKKGPTRSSVLSYTKGKNIVCALPSNGLSVNIWGRDGGSSFESVEEPSISWVLILTVIPWLLEVYPRNKLSAVPWPRDLSELPGNVDWLCVFPQVHNPQSQGVQGVRISLLVLWSLPVETTLIDKKSKVCLKL